MRFLSLMMLLVLCSRDRKREWISRVTLDADETSVAEILAEIRRQTGVRVEMDEAAQAVLDPSTRVQLKVTGTSARITLALLFKPLAPHLHVIWRDEKNVLVTVCRWGLNR